jgi:NCAIR mutase (PurE)-related protein
MEANELSALLARVAAGTLAPDAAAAQLAEYGSSGGPGWTDLGYARVDTDRARRTGDPEVVYGAGKTPAQAVGIVTALRDADPGRAVLVTRAGTDVVAALVAAWPDAGVTGPTVTIGQCPAPHGRVAVVSAGTSDAAVADEAEATVRAFGADVTRIDDVGVAGLHRLLAVVPELRRADCLVVIAGMEGALPSVVAGLVGTPLVAVPTSIGYGVTLGGLTALLAMLSSCAPGVVVCNIDNGFGAGVFAARVARRAAGAARADQP